jgi:multidrug efflux pump subunit AcrB
MEVPAGRVFLPEQEKLVRVTGRIRDPMAFHDVVVTTRQNVPVRVRDLATVVDGAAERRSSAFLGTRENGETRAVSVEVLKISGSNTVEVATPSADRRACSLADIEMRIIHDDSVKIRHALSDVQMRSSSARLDLHYLPVPELVALDGHHGPHAADLGHLGVLCDVHVRLHDQHHDAAGTIAGDRVADR